MNPGTRKILPFAIVGVAAAAAAVMILLRPSPPRLEPPSRVPVVSTRPVVVRSGAIEVAGSGTVRPRAEVDVTTQIPGRVTYVSPRLVGGGRVAAGALLVRIDSADYVNAVEQARAAVAEQEVAVLQAAEEAAISREEYERFLARQRALGMPAGDTVPSPLVLREPQLDAARAGLARARSQLADAELALSRTRITAPYDGVVRSEAVALGSYVTPGQSLARLYASDEVEVVLPLSDGDAALVPGLFDLHAGDGDRSVRASVYAGFGAELYRWDGYVDRARGSFDEQSRTIDVVVRVPRPLDSGRRVEGDRGAPASSPPLLVGQYADVVIEGRSLDEYAIVPRSALRPGDVVWAVRADSTVRIVPVRTLQTVDQRVFVVGDLADGELVVTRGVRIATDGMRVRLAGPLGVPGGEGRERGGPGDGGGR